MALADLCFRFGESIVRSDPLWVNLSFRKKVQKGMIQKNQELGLELTEGKKALMYQAYCILVEISLKISKKENIANHLFWLLDFNIISRAEKCVESQANQIIFLAHIADLFFEIEERPD